MGESRLKIHTSQNITVIVNILLRGKLFGLINLLGLQLFQSAF
jgi:hypothetical protein